MTAFNLLLSELKMVFKEIRENRAKYFASYFLKLTIGIIKLVLVYLIATWVAQQPTQAKNLEEASPPPIVESVSDKQP